MAYQKTVWEHGDLITKEKLNANENQLEFVSGVLDELRTDVDNIDEQVQVVVTESLEQTVQNGYVEDGVAYFTNGNSDVLFTITGIGGGGGGGTTGVIFTAHKLDNWSTKSIITGAECPITLEWSSLEEEVPTGNGSLKIEVNNITREIRNVAQGEVVVDVGQWLIEGTNSISLTISDTYNNYRKFAYTVNEVSLVISSTFDTSTPFTTTIPFSCTLQSGISEKVIHIQLDGMDIVSETTTLRSYATSFPAQSHGAHRLRVWFTVVLNGFTISSNVLYYEFMATEEGNSTPIITSNFDQATVEQYYTVNIYYRVYSPTAAYVPITIAENDVVKSSLTVDSSQQVYSFRADTPGLMTVRIAVSSIVYRDITLTINSSDINIQPETQNLALYLSAQGRSNSEPNPAQWTYNNISSVFTGFNWITNGWKQDEDGITVLRLNDEARVTIPYQLFANNNFRNTGKTIEIEFATRDVRNYSANILTCWNNNIGLKITSQNISIKGAQTEIGTLYKDNEHIRLSITIDKQTDNRLILVYINGLMSRAIQYASGESFAQASPQGITIGASDCGIDVYTIRVYDNNLTSSQIVNNWIADTQVGSTMIERYLRNQVVNENEEITIASLNNSIAYMLIESESLPQSKGDKKTVSGQFVDPLDSTKSFTFDGCEIDVQGTSSSVYYIKNLDLKFKQGFVMDSGETTSSYALFTDSIPFNRFVLKADVASSESTNNTGLVMFYNDTCPYKVPEMNTNNKVRWGIEGRPIVMFWHNPTTNITKFMGKYNFNLPKRAAAPYGYSGNDESWEVERNNSMNVKFQDDDFTTMSYDPITQTSYPEWYDDFEARFPDDTWRDITQLKAFSSFIKSTDRTQATGYALGSSVTYTVNSEATVEAYRATDNTFTVTDEMEGGVATGRKNITFTADTPAYRLTKFAAEFPKYAELSSAEYYYLFTELFLMIDSRAKNMFVGFHGSTNNDPSIPLRRKAVFEPYDMDTAIGTNNSGVLMFGYNLEDTDYVDSVISGSDQGGSNAVVYNGQDSVLWCNLRDAFRGDLVSMYRTLRSGNNPPWSYNAIESRYEVHQSAWCETIFNEDAYVKYLTPLVEAVTWDEMTHTWIKTDRYLTMLQGSKEEQRKWWLSNRFRYLDSKYLTGDAAEKTIDLRLFNEGTLNIKGAIDMYISVRFGLGSTPQMQRAAANSTASFVYSAPSGVTEMETSIYSADLITDVGDLSGFYPNELNFSKATRLKDLKIGSSASGYSNTNLRTFDIHNSVMLETIDCRNCPNLNITVNLENSPKLREAYFEGTSITGVDVADGGALEVLHLPNTITALTLMNLSKLDDTGLVIAGYNNIGRLMLANMDLDIPALLAEIPAATNVYISGLDLTVSAKSEIDDFYDLLDTMKGVTREWDPIHEQWLYHDYDKAQISGTIHINSLTGEQVLAYRERYPYIEIDATYVTSTLYYYNFEGDTLLYTEANISKYGTGVWDGAPTHEQTAQYIFEFSGWSLNKESGTADPDCRKQMYGDRKVYAAYNLTTRVYDVVFYNGETVVQLMPSKPYGSTIVYTANTPVYPDPEEVDDFIFDKFMTDDNIDYVPNMPVLGSYTFKARYIDVRNVLSAYLRGEITSFESDITTKVGQYAFYDMDSLQNVNITSAGVSIEQYAFAYCSNLINFSGPVTSIGTRAFYSTPQLAYMDLTNTSPITINSNIFYDIGKLNTLIIRSNTISALNNINIIENTPIAARLGGIYVPESLVSSYKAATNWSGYDTQIYPIVEESGQFIPVTDFSTVSVTTTWEDLMKNNINVGDIVVLPLTDTNNVVTNCYLECAAKNRDVKEDGTTAKVTWIARTTPYTHTAKPSQQAWDTSALRTMCNTTIFNALPTELQNLIVPVRKYSTIAGGEQVMTYDKVWAPSLREWRTVGTYRETDGVTYTDTIFLQGQSGGIGAHNALRANTNYTIISWWSRTYGGTVNTSGGPYGNVPTGNSTYGVIFGFCCDYVEEELN